MNKKAYVIVSPEYLPHSGGVERYSFFLGRELKRKGYDIFIVASRMKEQRTFEEESDGMTVFRFPTLWMCQGRMPVILPTSLWNTLKQHLLSYSDVKVVVQTNLYLMSLLGTKFAKNNGWKCAVIVHGSNYVLTGKGMLAIMEHGYERWIAKNEKKNGALFASVSKRGSEFVQQLGYESSTILHNAVQIEEFISESKTIQIKRSEKLVFTYVGRLIKEKGIIQLIRAFQAITIDNKNVELNVVGDGPLYLELKKFTSPQIVFHGLKEHHDVIEILRKSDVFILPSDSEGLPTSVLEAFASGAYPIVSPYGGSKEIIETVGWGTVMEGNTEKNIIDACNSYLNQEICSVDKELILSRLKNNFSWSSTADGLEKMFEE